MLYVPIDLAKMIVWSRVATLHILPWISYEATKGQGSLEAKTSIPEKG